MRLRFAVACAITSSVSAAKPMTRAGRPVFIPATVARMSGFSAKSSAGALPLPSFFIFDPLALATRQSATAAAKIAASAGRADFTAPSISSAVSTAITSTPAGGGTVAGPVTKLTLAPRSRNAAASAVPCAPEERLAI